MTPSKSNRFVSTKANPADDPNAGVAPVKFISIGSGPAQQVDGEIVDETLSCVTINGQEIATIMCSPFDLDHLALGLLLNEGIIHSLEDVASLHISESNCIDLWLNAPFTPPEKLVVTAGCGGGITFDDLSKKHPPIKESGTQTTPLQLSEGMQKMHLGAGRYQRSRRIHTAALVDGDQVLIQSEDVGRHNCLDKLAGAALLQSIDPTGKILFTSGRISSEMINKARRMECPIVCSRTSPTSLSTRLAEAWNITIVAYLRQNRMRVYTHPHRIQGIQHT